METIDSVRIISMLGEVNNKVGDMGLVLKDIQERMNKNFNILAESQVNANEKLEEISDNISDIKFKISVLESGVGLNASKIEELSK